MTDKPGQEFTAVPIPADGSFSAPPPPSATVTSATATTDTSGSPIGAAAAALPMMLLPAASALTQKITVFRSEGMRAWVPWRSFFGDASKYNLPSATFATARISSNLSHFQLNYAALLLCFLALVALFNFKFLLIVAALGSAWAYLAWWRTEPLVVFGNTIPQSAITISLFAILFAGLWLTLGNFAIWFLLFLGFAIFTHAILFISQDETVDFSSRPV